MPHREGYPGRRDGSLGHRDGTPDKPIDLLRQARRILLASVKYAKEINIPQVMIEAYKFAYYNARDLFADSLNDPPPEPDPLDGYTVYWDKSRRYNELLCAHFNVDFDRNGRFNADELIGRMKAADTTEGVEKWREFLLNIVKDNAVRYNMSDEWVEAVRKRMHEPQESQDGETDSMQKTLLLLYTQS
jgi:hypothetical protein